MVYDKTIFKPEEIDKVGRYKFSLVGSQESSGQSDASLPSSDGSDTTEAPSQFDLGDFSKMKPAETPVAGGQEDELPLLGGPETVSYTHLTLPTTPYV